MLVLPSVLRIRSTEYGVRRRDVAGRKLDAFVRRVRIKRPCMGRQLWAKIGTVGVAAANFGGTLLPGAEVGPLIGLPSLQLIFQRGGWVG